jgi:PAS domain S-box-containing protein
VIELSRMELSRYLLEALWKDEEFILYRGQSKDDASGVLVLSPVVGYPAPESLKRLEHEYSLREELDPKWAARPIAITRHWDRTVLVLEDTGGVPLDQLLGHPLDLESSLRLAIGLSTAIDHLHRRGIIHKDIKPANILVNSITGQCWLRGFGIASRLPRERQSPEPPEFVAGTLAYMAPEQTGRMNRSIDSRSDLYALGVTLYEMLTGSLPFTASDPMEWVHCHIARQPVPPGERLQNVPASVSAIIMKLLAKTAEERYQTAAGVESDLQRCLGEWETQRRIEEFPLGEHDTPDRLLIPEKLYGRAREIDTLLASFDRVVESGSPELVLISGYSGIGKSSVVNELHKVLVAPRGLFASGKLDQYKRNIPYATLAQALQNLVRQILGKSDAEMSRWRFPLLDALGPNGQLMVTLIPELALIIGEQPPVPELPQQEWQNRFQLVFRRFLGVFARPEHPLALFLDDLQWLDSATLDLIEHLVVHPEVRHLLLVGAYRDNEVRPSHPLARMLARIRGAGGNVREILLSPLIPDDVERLLIDALHTDHERVRPLAGLVFEKTAGNPFFTIQFLLALKEEALLAFDPGTAAWTWDLPRIRAKGFTDNVADLMAAKLSRLPPPTQKALGQLACLGNVADTATLTLVHGGTEEAMHVALWDAVRAGSIIRSDRTYAFLHDRIQEAAYALIDEGERAEAHLRIGRLLAAKTPPEELEENIFEVVNQFDHGAALIVTQGEREQVAEFNLIAGKRAKMATAYTSALQYLTAGRALLPENGWEECYQLAFQLELNRAECEYLTGELALAEEHLAMLSVRAQTTVDAAAVTCVRINLYTILDQSDSAVEVGLDYLRRVDGQWPAHPTADHVRQEYDRLWQRLGSGAIEGLLDLPLMSDPDRCATMDVLTVLTSPALFTDLNLFRLVIGRMGTLSLEHGNSDGSCLAYAWLGGVLGTYFGDYQAGFRFGTLGINLVEKHRLDRFSARVYLVFAVHVAHWTQPLWVCSAFLRRAFQAAQDAGDLSYAAYSCIDLITNRFASGDSLSEVEREAEDGLEFARKVSFGLASDCITGQLRLIRMLRGLTPDFNSFNDAEFDEDRFSERLENNPQLAIGACWYWIRKLQACVYAGDDASAMVAASKVASLLWTAPTQFELAEYHFYGALARAAHCDMTLAEERSRHLEALTAHYEHLAVWAKNCPPTFATREVLVAAEIARLEGRELEAMHLYEDAIRWAREHGFVQNEGLGNELAARFYAARGFEKIARAYLRDAQYCYLRWGADGKVRQLQELYPHLREEEPAPGPTSTIGTSVEHLDLATVIKVSQAVSGEIVLEKLIDTLMRTAIEHAGAERGLLILPHGEEHRIAAEAETGRDKVEVQLRQRLVTPAELPESLLRYVVRTQESVILDDASLQNRFSEDEYVRQRRPRSVLCLPLVKQARLMGVLYLENNLAPRVFTSDRFALLELLASQAAISLDNATLYADLAKLNADLTQENCDRRRAEEALRASEERLQDIIDNTSAVIYVKDLELRYILINREYERCYRVRRDQIRGKTDFDILPHDVAEAVRDNDRQVIEAGVPIQFEETAPSDGGERVYVSAKFLLRDRTGKPYAVCGVATDITELKRLGELQAALARERELFAQQRAAELAKANEALRECLSALASVPELDDFLGQVMAAITRQLGAVTSTLRVLNLKQNTLTLELLFQDGRVMSPTEANFPESWRFLSLDGQRAATFLDQRTTVARILDPHSPIPEGLRFYLLGLGIKTLLIIPLTLGGQANGQLSFRFTEERDFHPEELEIARALAIQASLAIHLTRLAKTARQSAVMEERTQLAAEIHDALAQSFTAISMQLGVAEEQLAAKEGDLLRQIQRANEIAKFGLAEARRSILSLRSSAIEQSGLTTTLQRLVEHSNVAGRLRCDFRSDNIPEERLPPRIRHELLRFAQEAISNAVRHAKPTVVSVTLRWEPPNLILKVRDNGSGISSASLEKREGFGLSNMRTRASQIDGKLEIQTAAGHGTSIILTVPIPS